jgi:16S rRNA (cytosine1402-N4)-methyltransferase
MLAECLSWLNLRADAVIVDGTVGGGGHAAAILERIGPEGRLIGLDRDREALAAAAERLATFGDRALLVHASFRDLEGVLERLGVDRVDGVLLDLGVSSHQLDVSERGFRFGGDTPDSTPLDMRMDQSEGPTAADWLREASEEELQSCFQRYGELPGSKRLARAIVAARRREPIRSAADLLDVIKEARIGGGRKHNPATLVFQALRIQVNDELSSLDEGLDAAVGTLAERGRIVVLAYHSAEDRIVKQRFRDEARSCICPPEVPVCVCEHSVRLEVLTRRPQRPGEEECRNNPRARSARLRAAARVAEAA